jgi:hypothetical protein
MHVFCQYSESSLYVISEFTAVSVTLPQESYESDVAPVVVAIVTLLPTLLISIKFTGLTQPTLGPVFISFTVCFSRINFNRILAALSESSKRFASFPKIPYTFLCPPSELHVHLSFNCLNKGSAVIKNAWSYTSTVPYIFMAWCTRKILPLGSNNSRRR